MPHVTDRDDCLARRTSALEWFPTNRRAHWEGDAFSRRLLRIWQMPDAVFQVGAVGIEESIEERFHQLATTWVANTRHISSTKDLTSYPAYQEIIGLGWRVVPLLLKDLQENKRFWFPALYAITNVRPFDPSDAGNGRRMTDAWIRWGRRKGLI